MFDFGEEIQTGGGNLIVWPKDGSKVALIDGDLLPYIVGYTVNPARVMKAQLQVNVGTASSIMDSWYFQDAADHMNWLINSWVRGAECDAARIYITDSSSNYRLGIAFTKPYKGQRKSEKPPFFYELRQYLLDTHGAILAQGCEADDLICIEMTADLKRIQQEGKVLPGSPEHRAFAERVCVTIDKDLRIVPGWHHHPKTQHELASTVFVDELGWLEPSYNKLDQIKKLKGAGLKFFYSQILIGDSADNYGGLFRCGPARAYELLSRCKTEAGLYYAVLNEYKRKYPNGQAVRNYRGGVMHLTAYQMMLEQGRLAWMQREPGQVWRPAAYLPHGESGEWNA